MNSIVLLLAAVTAGQPQARLQYHHRLDRAARMPAVVSPDGATLLYFARAKGEDEDERQAGWVYKLADVDGANQHALFETAVDWDDCLNALMSDAVFSADGQHVAVATTDNGRPLRDREDPGRAVPAICTLDGKAQTVPCELGSCGGFGFVGDDLLVLDTPGLISGTGYRLTLHRSGKPQVIQQDDRWAASCLRISPDGRHAVFFISPHVGSSIVHLRFVELAGGKTHDSPEFRSQNATFDGRPQLFWDDAGEGVYCHVSTQERSKWPFELTHYNFRTGKGFVASPERNIGASCTLGHGRIAVWRPEADGSAVLDVADKTLFHLPSNNYILGGRGRHVVIADLERDAVYPATLDLIAEPE